MAWARPRRSRAGQEGSVAGNSGGTGGSLLPGGGPAALGGGHTGLGRRREAWAPKDQCHHWVQFVTALYGRRGFNPRRLAPEDARQRSGRGRLGAGLGCYRWDRGGLGRKAERIDLGEQLPAPGVLLPQLLGLLPLLLDLALELPHPQLVLNPALLVLQHPLLVQHDALLVTGIPTPIEHRQKRSPPRQR